MVAASINLIEVLIVLGIIALLLFIFRGRL